MNKKRTITFTVENFEYEEIMMYARIKGHGGQFPTSSFSHYAVFQQMKKYPCSETEITKYKRDREAVIENAKAVQPNALHKEKQGVVAR